MYVCVCVSMYVCMYVCMNVYMYMFEPQVFLSLQSIITLRQIKMLMFCLKSKLIRREAKKIEGKIKSQFWD